MDKKKWILMSIIFLFVVIFSGGTLALWQWLTTDSQKTEVVFTLTQDFSCSVDGGGNITHDEVFMAPTTCTSEHSIKRVVTAKADIDRDNVHVFMDLWLDVKSIDNELVNSGNFRYAITTSEDSCTEGVVNQGVIDSSREILFTDDVFLSSSSNTYYLYVWLDAAETDRDTMNRKFNIALSGECQSDNTVTTKPLADHINTIYNSSLKTTVTNDSVIYNYATDVSLMNDRLGGVTENYNDGNIRYYGAKPANYVYFNCTDYSNPNRETCELWRIIGLFKNVDDGHGNIADRVKIVRANSLGLYTLDTTPSSVNSGYGTNDWSVADLGKMLNPGFEDYQDYNASSQLVTLNNSLYWNRTTGNCYNGRSNAVGTCDFSTNGITNATKNFIEDAVYYLGSFGEAEKALMSGTYVSFMERFHAHEMYGYERSSAVNDCSDVINSDGVCVRPTEWTGKIALMYPSDYVYATDFNLCGYDGISFGWSDWAHSSSNLVTEVCYNNDWLKGNDNEWLLTPHNTPVYRSFTLQTGKYLYGAYNWRSYNVRPTLYLRDDVLVTGGIGTANYPYKLSYES